MTDRRKFLLNMARGVGLASLAGLTWSAYVDEVTASSLILRPPAAINEKDFLARKAIKYKVKFTKNVKIP